MKKYTKGFIVMVILLVFVIILAVFGVAYYIGKSSNSSSTRIENNLLQKNIQSIKLGSLEFYYPEILTLRKDNDTMSFYHSIDYKHQNSCDFKGDGVMLDKLHDFNAFFRIYNKDLINSIKFDFSSGSIIQNFIKNNTLTLDPGFIDKYKMGSFDGYRITEGVEGCGRYLYYFPISSNQTLMINRNFYAETFQGDKSELSKIPGFITFEQEELIFKDILLSVKRFEKENDIKNIEKKNSWLLDSKTGLFYDPSWEITPETYRTPVQEVNGESPQIVGYRFTLPSGNSINWGGNQSSCSNNEFPKFQYGVSTVVCLKGVRSNVGLSDVRLIIPKEDLNAFGDFVLKNGLSSTIQNSSTYIIEVYSNNSSSGADRNYKGELTFLNSKLISGFQNYNVLQGGGCTTNCERKTECIIKNQQWIGKNGDECTIEKYISLTKEGIEQQIKAKEIIPSEDFKNCHSVVCYRIKK